MTMNLVKKNLVLSQPQLTIDHTFMVPTDAIPEICSVFVKQRYFSEDNRKDLMSISDSGLQRDVKLELDASEIDDLGKALNYVRHPDPPLKEPAQMKELTQIGGNPGIFALRGYYLGAGDPNSSLPIVRYAGLLPQSYRDYESGIDTNDPFHEVLLEVFREDSCASIDEKPMSMSLEGKFKVIFPYRTGRTLGYLKDAKDKTFTAHLGRMRRLISKRKHAGQNVLFAFPGGLDSVEDGAQLLNEIEKTEFPANRLFFFGCSSFREGTQWNQDETKQIWESMLERADILSMNETELSDLHTVVVGNGTFQDKALSYKLMELPTEAIKVCHSSAGSLMDPGPDPGRFLNAEAFKTDPSGFLEQSLWLATDGAAYGIASQFGNHATEAAVRIFSIRVGSRNADTFKAVFLNVLETMPPGLIAVPAPLVARPMSALTGIGARFDALLAAFLMRS